MPRRVAEVHPARDAPRKCAAGGRRWNTLSREASENSDGRVVTRMTDRKPNVAGYAALLGALLDTRRDDATIRFDAELDAALASNRIDDATARALRWWQRAAVRSTEGYLRAVLPGLLALQDAADAHADAEAVEAAASWSRARGLAPGRSVKAPVRMRLVAQTDAVRAAFAAPGSKRADRPGMPEADGGERARPATPA